MVLTKPWGGCYAGTVKPLRLSLVEPVAYLKPSDETNHQLNTLFCDCLRAGSRPALPALTIIEVELCRVLRPEAALQKITVTLRRQMRELPKATNGPATMQIDRRCVQRKRLGGISYLEFEAGRGGIVLDASEKGLGFRAADAVQQLGPSRIRIWTSPRPEERIEITGTVVWTDSSNKTGGLRFIETGAGSSDQIRTWLWRPSELEASPQFQAFPRPARSAEKRPEVRGETRQNANPPRSPVASRAKTQLGEARPIGLRPIPGLSSLFTSNLPGQSQGSQASQRGIAYRLATGFLIGVFVVAGAVLFEMFRPEVGALLIHLGEKITGIGPQRQTSSPPPSSAPVPALPSPSTEAKPAVLQKEASGDSALPPDSSRQVNSQSPSLAIPRTKEAPDPSPYRRSPNSAQDRSAEVTRLWSAVASGDSSAEVDLARLYLRGDGVPRNCEQAKVLLKAAAKRGSVEARQQLKEQQTSGCP
jgi:PilZ domain